jgi:DNA polymerase
MPTIRHDFETRSTLDLREVGAWRYSRAAITDIWCCAFAVDDGPIKLWVPGDPVPDEFSEAANNPDWLVSAFNDAFERAIERNIMTPRYGWPAIPIERRRCSQAAALSLALPGSLDGVAKALSLDVQKDAAGARLMKRMSKPRKPRPGEDPTGIYWHDDPEDIKTLHLYCQRDVETEREAHKRIGSLTPEEQSLWEIDARINERGV